MYIQADKSLINGASSALTTTPSGSPFLPQYVYIIHNFSFVAVVGMLNTEGKPANFVTRYLLEHGYNTIPVNPTTTRSLDYCVSKAK